MTLAKLTGFREVQAEISGAIGSGSGLPRLNFLFDQLLILIP